MSAEFVAKRLKRGVQDMAKLFGAQKLVLQAIQDSHKDAAGFVTDTQVAQSTSIALNDVGDWLETLEGEGLIEVARTTEGLRAAITARGRLQLNLFDPTTNLHGSLPGAELIEPSRPEIAPDGITGSSNKLPSANATGTEIEIIHAGPVLDSQTEQIQVSTETGTGEIVGESLEAMLKPRYSLVFRNVSNADLFVTALEIRVKRAWVFQPEALALGTFPPSAIVPVNLDSTQCSPTSDRPHILQCGVSPMLKVPPGQPEHIEVSYISNTVPEASASVYLIETLLSVGNGQTKSCGESLVFVKNAQGVYQLKRFGSVPDNPSFAHNQDERFNRNGQIVKDLRVMPKLVEANPVLKEFLEKLERNLFVKLVYKGQEGLYKDYPQSTR